MNQWYLVQIKYWQNEAAISHRSSMVAISYIPYQGAKAAHHAVRFQRRAKREAAIARRLLSQAQGWADHAVTEGVL